MKTVRKIRSPRLRIKMKLKISGDFFAEAAMVISFSNAAVRFVLNNTIGKIGPDYLVDLFFVVLFFGTVFISVLMDRKRRKSFCFFMLVFCAVLLYFGGTLVFHPEYLEYYQKDTVGIWDELFSPITGCIYGLLIVLLCRKSECIWKSLTCCAWIDIVYLSIRVLLASRSGSWSGYDSSGNLIDTSYDLGVGYSLMFTAIIFLCSFCRKKRPVDLIMSLYAILLALDNGSRGALLCLCLCISLLVICNDDTKQRSIWQKIKVVGFLAAVILILTYFDKIIIAFGNVLYSFGLTSRTVDAMRFGTLMADNGRDSIAYYAMEAIRDGGIIGQGAFGDRPYIAPHYWWGYSHNIILELLCDFGIILGPVLIGLLLFALLKVLFAPKKDTYRYSFIVLLSICGKMIVSDTIWGFPQFWALLGILILFAVNSKSKYHIFRRVKNGG